MVNNARLRNAEVGGSIPPPSTILFRAFLLDFHRNSRAPHLATLGESWRYLTQSDGSQLRRSYGHGRPPLLLMRAHMVITANGTTYEVHTEADVLTLCAHLRASKAA